MQIQAEVKYRGVTLKSKLNFGKQLRSSGAEDRELANFLGCLLPNFNEQGDKYRALYMGVVKSIILHGASICYNNLGVRKAVKVILRATQCLLSTRVDRGNKTTYFQAAMTLLG